MSLEPSLSNARVIPKSLSSRSNVDETKANDLNRNAAQQYLSSDPDQRSLSSASHESSSSESQVKSKPSKKREGKGLQEPQSRQKQSWLSYNRDYCTLFNETVNSINGEPFFESFDRMPSSQIGITSWSSREKAMFFHCLSKKGKNDLPSIAMMIGTKTELEVHVYLQLLQEAVTRQQVQARSRQLFDKFEIPAAFEISENCFAELELAADALCAAQEREDRKLERRRYKKLWLLNTRIARWVERCYRGGENGEVEIQAQIPIAELLNLKSFLKLSEKMFMNSSVSENNWRYYSTKKPSILYTAFSDFHGLAISVTRRLVQSTILFALSRLRAASVHTHKPKRAVRRQDVAAALNVLGMSHNNQDFWTRTARRCKLTVYDNRRGGDYTDQPLAYENVEKALSTGLPYGFDRSDAHVKAYDSSAVFSQGATSLVSSAQYDPSEKKPSYKSNVSGNSVSSKNSSPHSSSPSSSKGSLKKQKLRDDNDESSNYEDEDNIDDDEDVHAETLDSQASRYEEQRLWKLLGKEPLDSMKLKEMEPPKVLFRKRKFEDELEDWRSLVNYVPEWQTYETPIPLEKFIENRKSCKKQNNATSETRREPRIAPNHQDPTNSDQTSAIELAIPSFDDTPIEEDTESLESNSKAESEDDDGSTKLGVQEPEDMSEEGYESSSDSNESEEESEN